MTLPNPASAGFHEALGYTFVGAFPRVGHKQGAWHDVGFYSLDLVPDATPPAPLRTLDQLPGNVVAVALELPFVAALGSHPR